jgi:hypothetical protein
MAEDPDWLSVPPTPNNLRSRTHEQLLHLHDVWANNQFKRVLVEEEINQRFLGRIGDLTERLIAAVNQVEGAVKDLVSSSDRLERLTVRLNFLTIVLVVLTVFAVLTPLGVEIWHFYHPEKDSVPILFRLPSPPVPTNANPSR